MSAAAITVPQANPGAGYRAQKAEIDAAVARALASGWYILGKEGEAFEHEYAAWLGATARGRLRQRHRCAGAGAAGPGHRAGLDGRHRLAHRGRDRRRDRDGRRDAAAARHRPRHLHDGPEELAAVLDDPPPGLPPIRAVIAVHLYGQACELDPMLAACAGTASRVIEDCAQAHGATLRRPQGRHASARPRPSASIPPRTSARWAMAACWRPTTSSLADRIARASASMAGRSATSARWSG